MRRNMRYVVWFLVVVGVLAVTYRVGAQKVEKGTVQRVMHSVTRGNLEVQVFDTTGVCIYVAFKYNPSDDAVGITAVPKTQLPVGAGCQ